LIFDLHDNPSRGHIGVARTLAEALDKLWWKRIRQDVEDFCEWFVVCRQAKIQPHMVATLSPLHGPPKPWHRVGLDYFTPLHVSNGFDNVLIVVDHLTRMAHFLPFTTRVTTEKTANLFCRLSTYYTDYLKFWSMIATRNSAVASGRRLGDALERGKACLSFDTRKQMD
jgi:hypothetical protein